MDFWAALPSLLLVEGDRPLLDLLLLDLGGGDLDLDLERERDEVLDIEAEREGDLLRLSAAVLPSGDGDLDASLRPLERLLGERSREEDMVPDHAQGGCDQ